MNIKEKCLNCVGGYLAKSGMECPTCLGTGFYSKEQSEERQKQIDILRQPIEKTLKYHFICEHCGTAKVHYRKTGYRCPRQCEGEHK